MSERLVLDLETQKDFAEVEGRKPELLKISLLGVYSYEANRYDAYMEADLPKLFPRLQDCTLLIGFNIRKFDLAVLQPYSPFPLSSIPLLDIMEEVVKALGHRLSLDSLSKATLGRGKSGHGLEALQWFKEGRFDLIAKYCLDDVKLTKELYEYGKEHGKLFATGRYSADKLIVPVFWPDRKRPLETIAKILGEAFEKRLQVEIEYLSQQAVQENAPPRTRRVDVYHIQEPYFEGFDNFRQEVRQFRIDRILEIRPTWQRYTVPDHFVSAVMTE